MESNPTRPFRTPSDSMHRGAPNIDKQERFFGVGSCHGCLPLCIVQTGNNSCRFQHGSRTAKTKIRSRRQARLNRLCKMPIRALRPPAWAPLQANLGMESPGPCPGQFSTLRRGQFGARINRCARTRSAIHIHAVTADRIFGAGPTPDKLPLSTTSAASLCAVNPPKPRTNDPHLRPRAASAASARSRR